MDRKNRLIYELESARKWRDRIRNWFLLATLGVLVGFGICISVLVDSFSLDEFEDSFQLTISRFVNEFEEQGPDIVERTLPVYLAAIRSEMIASWPKILKKSNGEFSLLEKRVKESAKVSVAKDSNERHKRIKAFLASVFPKLPGDSKVEKSAVKVIGAALNRSMEQIVVLRANKGKKSVISGFEALVQFSSDGKDETGASFETRLMKHVDTFKERYGDGFVVQKDNDGIGAKKVSDE